MYGRWTNAISDWFSIMLQGNATLLTRAEQGIIFQHRVWDCTYLRLRQQLGALTNKLNWTQTTTRERETFLNTNASLSH